MLALLAVSTPIAPASRPRASRWARVRLPLFAVALAPFVSWLAIRHVSWAGPAIADGLRALVGSEAVTELEELTASVEDTIRSTTSSGEVRTLASLVEAPSRATTAPPENLVEAPEAAGPASVAPLFHGGKSPSDGTFEEVPLRSGATGALHRTLLHPDPERTYAELFVFAFDLSKVDLEAVAGSREPYDSSADPKESVARPGRIPEAARGALVAAFNGGFKAEHGHYGMMSDGNVWLAPRERSCTIARTLDGELRLGDWSKLAGEKEDFVFFRQAPPCMVEGGELHAGLRFEGAKGWGATIDGETVIRRSALGLSADGRFLFYGMTNSTTARALALGMRHVGADRVLQLDVNHSFPRLVLYREEAGALVAEGATSGLLVGSDEYVGKTSTRDFFYVTAKSTSR